MSVVGNHNNEVPPKVVMFSLPGNDGTTEESRKDGKELHGTVF